MTEAEALRRVEQAAKNAQWWRGEIAAGRIRSTVTVESLLSDLEIAGGAASRRERSEPERAARDA